MAQADLVAFMKAQGYSDAAMSMVLSQAGYSSSLSIPAVSAGSALNDWVGDIPSAGIKTDIFGDSPTPAWATALTALGLSKVLSWLLGLFGAGAVGAAILAIVGKDTILGWLGGALATILPGEQAWLGEWPAGLGSIEGRLVRKWTAGGAKTYFAEFEQPRQHGSHIQFYAWSPKKAAWLPYSYRRNIVFGAKELDVAAALGGRKRIGKKKALRALAGKYGGAHSK